jgi:hypothetical protein
MWSSLCRAILSKYGVRTQAEEGALSYTGLHVADYEAEAIFSAFDGSALSTAQRCLRPYLSTMSDRLSGELCY